MSIWPRTSAWLKEQWWGSLPFVGGKGVVLYWEVRISPFMPSSHGRTPDLFMPRGCTVPEISRSSIPLLDHPSHPSQLMYATPSAITHFVLTGGPNPVTCLCPSVHHLFWSGVYVPPTPVLPSPLPSSLSSSPTKPHPGEPTWSPSPCRHSAVKTRRRKITDFTSNL